MTESRDTDDPIRAVEELVRSAGGYVQVSKDLRPRVLEAARDQRSERRAQRRIRQMAVLVVLLGMFTTSLRQRPELTAAPPLATAAIMESLGSPSPTPANGGSDASWSMVESFTELRRRQAEILRLNL